MDSLINKKINKEEDVVLEQKPKKRFIKKILFLILIGLVISAVISWWNGGLGVSGDYQAVFLDNDQVYFGQLDDANQTYATLTDIFYLQIGQPLQPSDPATNVNLIKLGGELHGPIDQMTINREHILFIEDLRADSQVVQAIKRYKEQQTGQNK